MTTRIKELRKTLKLTQAAFGARIGMVQNSIAQMEGGRRPADSTVRLICKEYNVNEEWLREGTGDMFNKVSREEELAAYMAGLLAAEDDDIRRRFITAVTHIPPEGWKLIEAFADELAAKNKKDPE